MSARFPFPRPGRIDLWYTFLEDETGDERLAGYRGLLSSDEIDRYQRYRVEKSRHQYLVTRALVRTALSRYLDVPPERLKFQASEHGKPFLAFPADCALRFNPSHTNGLAACAVTTGGDIGLDVEEIQPDFPTIGISERFFCEEERQSLAGVPTEERITRFYELWTLKEALLKGLGSGLSIPLTEFAVRLRPDRPPAVACGKTTSAVDSWKFANLRLNDRFQVAVAVQSATEPIPICLRQSSPSTVGDPC